MTDAPPAASSRAYMRDQLPGIFHDPPNGVGLQFVAALEAVLDPIVAVLDALPAYVDPWLAPPAMLDLLAAWLGEPLDESWPLERRRRVVAETLPLARRRGTKAGLEAALELAFPHLPLRVEDRGEVRVGAEGGEARITNPPEFIVYCDTPLDEPTQRAVARVIERLKPAHVRSRLRVLGRRREGDED
jgi:phage tail-like protein